MLKANDNNKRIAKNTMMLYFRMFLIMGVTLFSFRIILKELGEDGYGIYNVVAGVVILFSFLSGALSQSTQRFLSYHIGRHDFSELRRVFSMSVNVHVVIAVVVLFLSETIGLWFLNKYMRFPYGMLATANTVYQCSIVTFIIQILTIPYQASIISNERMSFYAYFSIAEALLKLSAAVILIFIGGNKLVIYAVSLAAIAFVILFIYIAYCRANFEHCNYKFNSDTKLFRNLLSFSGWNMLGGIGNVGATQGVNVILNIFRGVTLNAAMGVSNQVSAAVSAFVSNMLTAFNPQIIKSYAADDRKYFLSLIFRASRFSFLLVFVIGFPVILCCSEILKIWLTVIPDYSVAFTQLIIVFCMIDAISGPLWTAAQASGRIKTYMLIIATMIFSNVPAAYIILYLELSPVWLMVYKVLMNLTIHFTRIGYLHWLIAFPSMEYLRKVMLPIVLFVIAAVPVPVIFCQYADSIIANLLLVAFTACESMALGLWIIVTKSEREVIIDKIRSVLHI